MENKIGNIVLPGDIIGKIPLDKKIRIGPGLIQIQEDMVATKCGILRNSQKNYYWIENKQKRVFFFIKKKFLLLKKYVPAIEDMVIGIIKERLQDYYR